MENRRGFTLAELLGVIILMGIIAAAIAVPILTQINKTSSKLDKATEDLLYNNTGLYMNRYSNTYKKINGHIYYITIEQLTRNGLLEDDFLDSYKTEVLSEDTQIKIVVTNNSYQYSIPDVQKNNIESIYNDLTKTNTYNYAGGTYIKGNHDENYIKFNGFMWRIMGKNIDGTIRLVMDEYATALMYYNNANYPTSYVREWLNDYFISRLQYNDVIASEKWFFSAPTDVNNVTVNTDVYIEGKVGLLSLEEFNLSLDGENSFLKGGCTGLLNQSDALFYSTCTSNYLPMADSNELPMTVKPVINVYGSTIVSGGSGTSEEPYVLAKEDFIVSNNATLRDIDLSVGSSIWIDYNEEYRIIEKGPDFVKVIYVSDLVESSKYADVGNMFNLVNGAGKLLNDYASYMFVKKNIFLGKLYQMGDSYKNTVFAKTNIVYDTFATLPIMGELLTGAYSIEKTLLAQDMEVTPENILAFGNPCIWTLTMASTTEAYQICYNGKVVKRNISEYNAEEVYNYLLKPTGYISLDMCVNCYDGVYLYYRNQPV